MINIQILEDKVSIIAYFSYIIQLILFTAIIIFKLEISLAYFLALAVISFYKASTLKI
jgi:hypothetical protein